MSDSAVAIVQPMGHASQIPVVPSAVFDNTAASATRRVKSLKVVTINFFIMPAPRKTPSATSFAATIR